MPNEKENLVAKLFQTNWVAKQNVLSAIAVLEVAFRGNVKPTLV